METRRRSRASRLVRRFVARSWQAIVVGVVVIAVGVLAFLSPGLVQADVRLDEGTVHVARRVGGGLGVLNAQIEELADYVEVGNSQFVILQDENVTLVHALTSSTLWAYDQSRNRLQAPTQLPKNAQVRLGGGVLMVVSPDNGKVWFGDPETVLALDFQKVKSQLEVGEFGTATVTDSGNVIGLDVQRSLLVRPGTDAAQETALPFGLSADFDESTISAVGNEAVVLDRKSSRIWMEGMTTPFEVSGARAAALLPPAPDALGGEDKTRAVYATRAGLIALTSDGPRSLTGNLDADPIEPVQVDDCIYAAFGEDFVRRCRGQEREIIPIPDVPPESELAFQVHRDTVVLNDMNSGVVWMVNNGMHRIEDWDRVIPAKEAPQEDTTRTENVDLPERDEKNTPPIAQDDDLGARAGRSTILNVLDNDTDPDGDILTIEANGELSGATLETVRGGAGLQITIDPETRGPLQFSYTINDGREGTAKADVTVAVLPADPAAGNTEPFRHERAAPLEIRLNQTVTKRVLMDWRDPDGDSLILVRAWMDPGAEDEVSFTPDGDVTFRDIGKTEGMKKVNVRVSDGTVERDGEMLVDVSEEVVAPIAYGDFASTTVGRAVIIHPLANDVGENLTLTNVDDEQCDCRVNPVYREKWFTFTSDTVGAHYVTYNVSNGPTKTGLVRIDVRAESTTSAPVAALDVALLPPGGSVVIDPLLNDTDDDGDVLVIQQVSQAPGLQVVLERRHLVTITDKHTPSGPVTLTYLVSDGKNQVRGTIIVIPTPSTGSSEPQAEPDELRVRAGATQSIDVLANDTSPVGLDLTLVKLVDNPLKERAWIDGDRIRVAMPEGAAAGSISLTYEIKDVDNNVSSSTLEVTVVSEDAQNEAPTPRPVEERVLAGTRSRLVIPLDGIDPNGDAVRLVGLDSGPQLGRVTAVGDGWLEYESYPESKGTDVFSYSVVDRLGVAGAGEIRVGVAPSGPENNPPTGILDEITVRPSGHVQIPALRNDVDVDGDGITYVADDPVRIDGVDDAEIISKREISFIAPDEVGIHIGTYLIEDSRGMQGSGELSITVDENAPELPPEARDDVVPVAEVEGKDWVEIDVTANDFDPDGRQEDLRVRVPDYGAPEGESAGPTEDGLRARVPVTQRMQQIRYEVVDADGHSATALILIPGRSDAVPVLKDPDVQLQAVAGEPLTIDINSHVAGTAGRSVGLTSVDDVYATHGEFNPNPQRIVYRADLDYAGPASVVFKVTDAVAEGDDSAKEAYVSIPITVTPAPNRTTGGGDDTIGKAQSSPELIGGLQPVLKVGPGEGNARLDLRPLFTDVDGDDFFFRDIKYLSGDKTIVWETSADRSRILARTAISTQPDTVLMLSGVVVDATDSPTPFQIRLQVVSSTRPTATTVTDTVDAVAGVEVAVPVLANDKSNLLNDKALTLVGTPTIIGGAGSVKVDGDVVRITPEKGFVGTLTARYTVMDATLDENRQVDGTIRVTVKDKPSPPGAPRGGVTGNGTVTFTYTPGSSNGFEILERTAEALGASGSVVSTTSCKSTTCTVSGLPNGNPYQFRVRERNQVGVSDPSPLSAAYTPDVKPNAPARPTVKFGDKELIVEWQPPTWEDPTNPGSKLTRYTLVLTDETGNQKKQQLTARATTHTWTGLQNGTRYRFSVSAGNDAGDSPPSALSDAEYPAGKPSASGSITALATENELGGAFDVTFATSGINANGDTIKQFIVTPISESGDAVDKALTVTPVAGASQVVKIEGLGQKRYRFKVQAVNKAGAGAPAATGDWQVAWELPKMLTASATAGEGLITVASTSNFDDRPQAKPVKEYSLDDSGWRPMPGDGRITGLTNGRLYKVSVRVRIEGGRASAPRDVTGLMPRTAVPVWPDFDKDRTRFKGSSVGVLVVLPKPVDLVKSGGWDTDGYQFHCRDNLCTQPAWTTSDSFMVKTSNLSRGAKVGVDISHRDETNRQTSHYLSLLRPFSATWDRGSRSFNFQLHYVRNATCTVTATSPLPDVAPFVQTWNQGGGNSLTPDPIPLPPGVDYTDMQLKCTAAEGFNETFTIS